MNIMTRVPAPIRRIGTTGLVAVVGALVVPLLATATPAVADAAVPVNTTTYSYSPGYQSLLNLWVGGAGQPGGGQGYGNPAHDDFEGGSGGSGYGTGAGNGGGGGAGGNSYADPSLTGVSFGTSGLAAATAGQIMIQSGTLSSTTVTSSAGTVSFGQPVTFHAFVDPTDGGGTVTFAAEGQTIPGCANLPFISGGGADWEANCTTSSLPMPPVGSDWITATYSGDSSFAGSSGVTAEFISMDTTSTSLTASPQDIKPDERVTLTASVSGGDGGGSVEFSFEGTALPGCGTVPLTPSGTAYKATCTASYPLPTWGYTGPVSFPVVATYFGDDAAEGSSGSAEVTVDPPAGTTTSLSLSSAGAVYGQEQAEKVSVTVTSPNGTPAGQVMVISPQAPADACLITLASGSGACTIPATELPPGTTQLTASYNGSADFDPSTSAVTILTVSKAATTTGLTVSPARVAYGHEQAGQLSVSVTSPGGTPGGTVTVKSGTSTICTITVGSGKGSCTPSATRFPAGTAQLTASYAGSADFDPSTSGTRALTVSKAATTTALSLSAIKVTQGHEQAERLTVKVAPQYSGTPGGTVIVKSGTVTVCTITLASGKGSCAMSAAKLPAGTHTLVAAYRGSSDFTSSTSARKTLTVVK